MEFFDDPEMSLSEVAVRGVCEEPRRMSHALNGGEMKIGNFLVDGWDGEKAYEMNGCAVHGCPKCFPDRARPAPFGKGASMDDEYCKMMKRLQSLRQDHQIEVEAIWECELREQLAADPKKDALFHSFKVDEPPLRSRDAFVGGRTCTIKLLHFVEPGEKILYRDVRRTAFETTVTNDIDLQVTSLYPWVNKNGAYPIGHVTVFTNVRLFDMAQRRYRYRNNLPILEQNEPFSGVWSSAPSCLPRIFTFLSFRVA